MLIGIRYLYKPLDRQQSIEYEWVTAHSEKKPQGVSCGQETRTPPFMRIRLIAVGQPIMEA